MPLFDSSQRLASEYRQSLALLQFDSGKDLTLIEQMITDDSIGSARRSEEFTPKFWLAKSENMGVTPALRISVRYHYSEAVSPCFVSNQIEDDDACLYLTAPSVLA